MTNPLVSQDPLAELLLPKRAGVALPAVLVSGEVAGISTDTMSVSVDVLGGTVAAVPMLAYVGAADFAVGDTVLLLGTTLDGISTFLILGPARRAPVVQPHSGLRGEAGLVRVSFTTLATFTVAVSFTVPFTSPPIVLTNIDSLSGVGETNNWVSRPYNITTTGFTLWVEAADDATDTWTSVPVNWVAMLPGRED